MELLWKGLGYDASAQKPVEDEKPEPPNIYRAKWLREAQGEVVDDDDEEVSVQKPYGESPKPVLISPEAPLQPTEHKTAVESGQSPLRSTPTETAHQQFRAPSSSFGRFSGS